MGLHGGAAGAGALVFVLACAACAGRRDRGGTPSSWESPDGSSGREGKRQKPARLREEPVEEVAARSAPEGTAAGKRSPRGVRAVFDFTVKDQATHGRIARDGSSDSTDGRPLSQSFALDLDLLFDRWMVSHELSTTFLPASLDTQGNSFLSTTRSHYGNWDLVLGPKLLEIPAESGEEPGPEAVAASRPGRRPFPEFRLDAFAGIRSHRFSEWQNFLGFLPGSHGSFGWRDPIAGLRAEWMASKDLAVRLRGDTKFSGVGSDHAWRVSAAAVFWASHRASLTAGWEVNSIHFERGRGPGVDRYDILLSGPFLALELRF